MSGCVAWRVLERHRGAFDDAKPVERHTGHDGALSPAQGTVATAEVLQAVLEIDLEDNSAAVAGAGLG